MVARPYSTAILLAGQIVVRDAGFSNRHVDPAWLLHRRVHQQQHQCCLSWFCCSLSAPKPRHQHHTALGDANSKKNFLFQCDALLRSLTKNSASLSPPLLCVVFLVAATAVSQHVRCRSVLLALTKGSFILWLMICQEIFSRGTKQDYVQVYQ